MFKVSDELILINNAKRVFDEGRRHILKLEQIDIDLTAVKQLDTAGLSVLLGWWQLCLKHRTQCHFMTSPEVESAFRVFNIELP